MIIVGRFYNSEKGITINFKDDGSYTLSGLEGYNTEFGSFKLFKDVKYSTFTHILELQHSTRQQDALSSGTYTFPITQIDNNTFSTIADGFTDEDFNGNRIPATFKRQ